MIFEYIIAELSAVGMGYLVSTVPHTNTTWAYIAWIGFSTLYTISYKVSSLVGRGR